MESIRRHFRFRLWNLDLSSSAPMPCAPVSSADVITWLVKEYARQNAKSDARYWIDHTPGNLHRRGIVMAGLFPSTCFIHLVRDGRAVAASLLPLDWGPTTVNRAAEYWAERVGYGLAAESHFGPTQVMRIRYEDLVCDPTNTLDRIRTFAGLERPTSSSPDPAGWTPSRYTAKQHARVTTPPPPTSPEPTPGGGRSPSAK